MENKEHVTVIALFSLFILLTQDGWEDIFHDLDVSDDTYRRTSAHSVRPRVTMQLAPSTVGHSFYLAV
jgi:hypothetical protein